MSTALLSPGATSKRGLFILMASTIGAEVHLPFGGVKQTGNRHREADSADDGCVRTMEECLCGFLRSFATRPD